MESMPDTTPGPSGPGSLIPVYLDDRQPELDDPAQEPAVHRWVAGCATADKLMRFLEAIRDTSSALKPLLLPNLQTDRRQLKHAITPVYNLAIGLRDLFNYIQSNRWRELSKSRQREVAKRFKQSTDAVPTKDGPLKLARDKIAAHLDKDLSTREYREIWCGFGPAEILNCIKACIKFLECLLHLKLYAWTRSSSHDNVCGLMTVDGREMSMLVENGAPTTPVGLNLVVSPAYGIVREARELVGLCIAIGQWCGKDDDA
jgi:hypothetical protein